MKNLYNIGLLITILVIAASCADDSPLTYSVKKPETVAVLDELKDYGALKDYIDRNANPQFKLGAGASVSDYTSQGLMYRLIKSNFDEITLGYEMKHGAVVQSDGSLSLGNTGNLFAAAEKAGTTVFGHTLCWHANQNAAYLNGLLSPLTIKSPAFNNSLDISKLSDGTLQGWSYPNSGAGILIDNNLGMGGGVKAVKLMSSSTSSSPTDLQLITPSIPVVQGHKYEVLFYIKSDISGQGRIAFEGLNNNTPKIDWTGSGTASETFTTSLGWKEIRFKISDFTGNNIKLYIDLGYVPNATYYIDVNNFYVYDTQGPPIITNLISQGDFETGGGWGGWGNGSSRGITANGLGANNAGKGFYVTNPSLTPNYWTVQTSYDFPNGALDNGAKYSISFWIKGSTTGTIRPEVQSSNYSSNGFGQVSVTTSWQKVTLETTVTSADRIRLIISYGEFAGTVYLDDVVLSKVGATTGGQTTIVQKTPQEKVDIVSNALTNWISGMVTFSKDHVKAWDVVNEPIDDGNPYQLKTGVGKTLTADEFYWQDYLGKDYAVTAFKLARKYGNGNDLLFINDYNLEYNLDKCKGLIQYVAYIESQGATVNGIGTQMHINANNDKDKIVQMLTLLAATGKQIKISELDMGVGVKTIVATDQNYQAQADMYKFVVEKYMQIIPANQRYGITIWSPKDSPTTSSWRPGEPIGLWTEGYNRKRAYAGVVEGFGGVK